MMIPRFSEPSSAICAAGTPTVIASCARIPEAPPCPALDDLLHDWTATFRPPYERIRVLGTRWSTRSYELRDCLARNQVPYQWIDVELSQSDPEVRGLVNSLGPEAE